MKMSIISEKLRIEKSEFVKREKIKEYCEKLNLDYETTLRYLLSRGYLARIFKGIFYVRSLEERKFSKSKYNHLELVSYGLKLKGVKDWYFGLWTGLKLNNITHEYFTVDYVINDKIFRANPITIAEHEFKFLKIKSSLLKFGIVEEKTNAMIRYSDTEKTVLYFVYIWKYNSIPSEKIIMNISKWIDNLSKDKVEEYAKKYPKSVRNIIEVAANEKELRE